MPERAESQVTLTSTYGAVGGNMDTNMHKVSNEYIILQGLGLVQAAVTGRWP